MKERKTWQKRIVSLLMALAMVVTQIGVWNVGKERVQAAETEVYKADFSGYDNSLSEWTIHSESDATVKVAWNDNLENKNPALSVYSASAQTIVLSHEISGNVSAGNYSVSIKTNGEKLKNGQLSIATGDDNIQSADLLFTNEGDYVEYKTEHLLTVADSSSIKITITLELESDGWGYLDDITLTKEVSENNKSDDTDEYVTKTLYFKYTGKGTPAILLWDKCGDSLKMDDDTSSETIDNKVRYKMEAADQSNWYKIVFKYKADEVKNTDVGFDFGEISNNTYSWIASMDYAYGNHKSAYEILFSDTYADPAIIQGDYDTVVSYKDAIEEENNSDPIVENAPITIEKVKNLSSDFIMGADISSMISELDSGVVYRDYDGNELKTLDDIVKFLAEQGINHIRVRVWNDPYDSDGNGYGGGNNDVAKAKKFAEACRKVGIKMLVDFHCSDLWTDPGKQQAPKAWKNYTLDQKAGALTEFIEASLNTIDPKKDVVDMVQVGNETTGGFIGETNVVNMCTLFSAGSKGVKAYNKDVKVVIHVESPHKGTVAAWAKNLSDNNVNYDIIATSYYPYWHGTLANLKSQFQTVKSTYGKDVMVAETSYAYTLADSDGHENTVRVGNNDSGDNVTEPFTEQGQATYIRNLINTVNEAGGLGVYYWEPAWLTVGDTTGLTDDAYDSQVVENKTKWEKYGSGWASSYASEYDAKDAGKWFGGSAVDNQAMFYPDGTATAALHVWNYVRTGAKSNLIGVEKIESFDEAIYQQTSSEYTLPETVKVTYSDGTSVDEQVSWNESEAKSINAAKVGTYKVTGQVVFSKIISTGDYKGQTSATVSYALQVKPINLITDASVFEFETSAQSKLTYSNNKVIKKLTEKSDAKSGTTSLGWYNQVGEATSATVTYNEAITLGSGNYVFETYAQGMAGDQVALQILDAEDNLLYEGTAVELTGWANWETPIVKFSLDKETPIKLRIKIDTLVSGWGSVDVLYLHENASENGGLPSGGSSTVTPSVPSAPNDTNTDTKDDNKKEDQKDDPKDVVTEEKNITATTPSGKRVEATVTVSKDKDGNVTEASAKVAGTKAAISAETAKELAKAAGTDRIAITASVTDKNGNEKYTVTVDSKNLTANKKLHVVAVDPKTGEYKLVNAKTYKVGKDGTLNVKLADGADYKMLTAAELKAVEKSILKTVEVKKPSVTVKNGKKTQIQLSSALDMDNVKSITYKTSKKSVASVSKSGKITTNKKGTATIKAIVTLKNGKKKTVSMTLKVK